MDLYIHPLSDVQSEKIGTGTRVWQFSIILPDAVIGNDCNICSHCFIENDVVIGNRVTIKNGVQLWDGLRVEDDVFIGPNATFTNDKYPKSKQYPENYLGTTIKKGASIGAGATILPGVSIGENALVAAGALVTQDIPVNAIVQGVPAIITGYTDTSLRSVGDPETAAAVEFHSGPVLYSLKNIEDIRGNLVVAESIKELPFEPQRMFCIYNVPSSKVRGAHAHKVCHQFLIAVHGSVNVILDNGKTREEYTLSDPTVGLHIEPGVWSVQYKYTKNSVLLVLASHRYQASDYIRDYNDFLQWKMKNT